MSAIAVGVDGSGPSRAALAWAAEDAAVRGDRLLVVRAFTPHSRRDEELGHSRTAAERRAADQLRRVLAERGGRPAPLAATMAVRGSPAQVLLDLGHRIGHLVVGAQGKSGVRRLLLGSVSEACVHRASCPVTVVHEPEGGQPGGGWSEGSDGRGLVVGVDGSEPSRRALSFAAAAALAHHLPLSVVVAWQREPRAALAAGTAAHPWGDAAAGFAEGGGEEATGAARVAARLLADELAGWGAERPEADCATVEGTPAQALLRLAHGARQVVVGRRGLGPVRRMVMGSVSTQVVRAGPCPVTVVP